MQQKGITVLSLFDGMSGAQQALERAGIPVEKYFSSEIDKYAIKVTMANYPNTIQLGSVIDVDVSLLPKINMLAGGSPCQSFSFAGKRKGMSTKCEEEILTLDRYLELKAEGYEFEGQSYLFWEYMRILTELRKVNPDILFLLENVEMGEKWEIILSKAIGVNGIHINSALVSAQNRKRIYWTNIGLTPQGFFGDLQPSIEQPKDKGILLKDILESEVDEKYFLSGKMLNYLNTRKDNYNSGKINYKDGDDKASCINASSKSIDISDNIIKLDKRLNPKANQDKASCFTAGGNSGGNHSDMDLIVHNMMPRSSTTGKGGTGHLSRTDSKTYCLDTGNTNAVEIKCAAMRGRNPENSNDRKTGGPTKQRLEFKEDGKTNCLTSVQKDNYIVYADGYEQDNRAYFEDGKSGTLDIKAGRQKVLLNDFTQVEIDNMEKSNCLTPDAYLATGRRKRDEDGNAVLTSMHERRIRRLTPTECERLQTVRDGYTAHVSDSQRYKMLGNGWTIDIISHIFSYINK